MEILSHRGFWKLKREQNLISGLLNSIYNKFGVEFDIRDFNSKIVISHDISNIRSQPLENFLKRIINKKYFLAINIKADGLQKELKKLLKKYKISNYFVFDMSIPDCIQYINQDINYFIRQSEYEKDLIFYKKSKGVWLDQFKKNWINEKVILHHYNNNKKICIVSPELHLREYKKEWIKYKKIEKKFPNLQLMLCTDFPNKAESFFND